MLEKTKSINRIFIQSMLWVAMGGIFITLLLDTRLGFSDTISIIVDSGIFFAASVGLAVSKLLQKHTLAILLFTGTVLCLIMFQLATTIGYHLGSSVMVVIVLGYIHSIVLKGIIRIVLHVITLSFMIALLIYQLYFPEKFVPTNTTTDLLAIAVPYILVYLIVTYTAAVLKDLLDTSNIDLVILNKDLAEKNCEIETQNEELNSHQEDMSSVNCRLEELVEERSHSIKDKNEAIARYGFRNAHNVRGPLARILGLIILSKIDNSMTKTDILLMIEKEATDIDTIIHDITLDLEKNID